MQNIKAYIKSRSYIPYNNGLVTLMENESNESLV